MFIRSLVGAVNPRFAVIVHDLFMVWLSWVLTHWIRLSLLPEPVAFQWLPSELPMVLLVQALVLWWTGLYRGLWRFASLPDLWNIARAAVMGALLITLALFLFNRLNGVPRSVLVLYPFSLLILLGLPRMIYRFWKDSRLDLLRDRPLQRVLILGAGRAGETIIRDLRHSSVYRVVGFLDDNRALRGAKVHGVPVLGSLDDLAKIAIESAAQMLLIAMPSANNQQMQRVVALCEATSITFRTVPRLQDVVEGRSQFNQIKEVVIEDLLGRDPVALDWDAIRHGITGRRALVSGGGGSIGSELCRQVARLGVSTLTVLDRSEFNLYRVEQELRQEFPDLILHAVLGDCCDSAACEKAFAYAKPNIVFHAAAYKHVPLLEKQAREAIRNNVFGTITLALAARQHAAESFILISTDKAVNPANVMGATKRVAEIFCQNFAGRTSMRVTTVRFGNVLDSAGSVVPLFREQIKKGGPVTVTHPEISRYFMTIPEACHLILQSSVLGQGGEIFALDMGTPIKIRYLAEQMIRLAGKSPDVDVPIVYTGLRAGEKLFEELFHEQENYVTTSHPKIFLAQSRAVSWNELNGLLHKMEQAVQSFDEEELFKILKQLVPEFLADTAVLPEHVVSIRRA
jgi:FlaA1/EpsC-like NDP-sugar epimerase